MPSAWVQHVKSVYAKGKSKGMSYKQAMIAAKSSYKKGGKSKKKDEPADDEKQEKPKGRRRKKKSPVSKASESFPVEESAPKPKRKRNYTRPVMPKRAFKNIN